MDTEPNEDGWYRGPERHGPAPSQTTIELPRDSGWQGGDPDSRPEVSGKRLLLTEAQMDINVSRPRKHFSAENGPSSRPADSDTTHSPLTAPEARAPGITRLPAPILDWLPRRWASNPPAWKMHGGGRRLGLSLSLSQPLTLISGLWLVPWSCSAHRGVPRGEGHNSGGPS